MSLRFMVSFGRSLFVTNSNFRVGLNYSLDTFHRNFNTNRGSALYNTNDYGAVEVDSVDNKIRDAAKDRSQIIPVETSIRYLNSIAYKTTYGDDHVWKHYRRNFKGGFAPRKTRKTCIRKNVISTGNPCPICRDEYLVLDEKNIQLLMQFISPFTGEVLDSFDTGLCQKKQKELIIAIERAKDSGAITFDVPFRKYNYADYGIK